MKQHLFEQQEALGERGLALGHAPKQQLPSSFTAAAPPLSAAASREAVLARLLHLAAGMLGTAVPADAPLIEVRGSQCSYDGFHEFFQTISMLALKA